MREYLKYQKDLVEMLNPSLLNPTTKKHRFQLLNEYLTCISSEVEEARMDLPWKHWKKYKGFKFDHDHFLEETIDILHFLLDIWIVLGVDHVDIAGAYLAKRQENIRRWIHGKDKSKRGKQMGKKLLRPNH